MISVGGRWRKRHSMWNNGQGPVGENLVLVIERKTSQLCLLLLVA